MSERRTGSENSATRALLLDTVERLMLAEGYAAVGVRRVAREAGVTPALIHYYFRTLDDLFLAVLRRNAARELSSLESLASSDRPLHALWERGSHPDGAAMTTEFLALANHRRQIRSEIAEHAARFRSAEVAIIAGAVGPAIPPVALSVLIAILSRTLVLEGQLGLTVGHPELLDLVRHHLDALEPPGGTAPARS